MAAFERLAVYGIPRMCRVCATSAAATSSAEKIGGSTGGSPRSQGLEEERGIRMLA
jgi:hypothetical protein